MNLQETTPTLERQQQPELGKKAGDLVRLAASQGGYGEFRNTMGLTHQESLQQATENIANNREAFGLDQADASFVDLLGRAGGFIESQDILRQDHETGSLSYAETRQLKDDHIIPFNQSLKEFINHHPSLTISELTKTLSNTYIGAFQRHSDHAGITNDTIYESFQGIAEGMRHEIAAETLLESIGVNTAYEEKDGSQLNDRRGEDLKVYLDANHLDELFEGADWHNYLDNNTYRALVDTWHSIDIKSSEKAEERGRSQHPNNVIAWTGLYNSDFRGLKNDTPNALTTSFPDDPNKGLTFLVRIINSATPALENRNQR